MTAEGWNVETLKEYMDAQLLAQRDALNAVVLSQQQQFRAQEAAISVASTSTALALTEAKVGPQKQYDTLTAKMDELVSRAGGSVPRGEMEALLTSVGQRAETQIADAVTAMTRQFSSDINQVTKAVEAQGKAILAVAFLGRWQLKALRKDLGGKADAAKTSADAALKVVTDQRDAQASFIVSVGQALNTLKANGSLTPEQVAAIAAAIAANQAAKGTKVQAGTTPGIPGSRSGAGTSVTPGIVGSGGARGNPVAASPGTSRSSTSNCLLTVESGILRLDGTVCPP